MSDHGDACGSSRDLCDELFRQLARLVPSLQRSQTEKWCAFYVEGSKRFAYVNHRKTSAYIDVWCLSDVKDFSGFGNIPIVPRSPLALGGKSFRFTWAFTARLKQPREWLNTEITQEKIARLQKVAHRPLDVVLEEV